MLKMLFLVVSLLAAPAWSAQTAGGKRFLFIIDASSGMKPMEMPLRETLFDLIYSGARGHMTNGDTYGVWLISDRNDTSFPMETWKEKFAVEIAAKAVSHLKDHGFKGRPNFMQAMVDVTRIVKNVEDLTVILVSNGGTPLVGTPFDEAINARQRELAPAMKAAKLTFNTALVAQDGKFVAWGLNSPQFLLDIPYVAPKPKPLKVEPPVTASQVASKPAKVVAAPPRVASNPIIITKESVAEERRSYVASLTTSTTAPEASPNLVAPTNIVSAPSAPVITNAVPSVITNETNTLVAKPSAPLNPMTNVAPAATVATTVTVETRATNAAVVSPTVPPAVLPVVASPASPVVNGRSTSFIFWCVVAGVAGAFIMLMLVLLIGRARRREPSLISQAIARERMQAR
jgi:hypothetical protein